MQVTVQVKLSIEKAGELEQKLDQMRKAAAKQRVEAERAVKAAKGDAQAVKALEALEDARALEGGMNTSNLMRLLVEVGMDQLEHMAPEDLLTTLLEVSATRGRPKGVA